MGNVTGSITATASGTSATVSGTAVSSSGGAVTLTSDEITKTKVEAVKYDTGLSTVNRVIFTVPSPGGSYSFKIKAPTLPNANWVHAGSMAIINFLGQSTPSTVTFSTQPSSVDEGAEATFEITTTGLEKGSSLQWSLVHVGDVSQPFHYDTTTAYGVSGGVTLDNSTSPKGTFKVKPVADETTTPTGKQKQFKIEIKRNGLVVATSNTITVNDTSKGPVYSLSLSPTTVDEGQVVTGTITATNPRAIGETLRWALVDVPSAYTGSIGTHFTASGTVAVANSTGTGTFTIDVKLDSLDNPTAKTFKVMLYNLSGAELLTSAVGPVTVNDTSKTPGLSSTIAAGGSALAGGDLNGQNFYSVATYATSQGGAGVSLLPDGSWFARETNGTSYNGKWFDPITKDIGNNYYVRITSTQTMFLGGGGTYNGDTDWTPLSSMVSFFAAAEGYRCVDPQTPILIDEDGTTKLAGDLVAGDSIYTMHEFTKMWGYYTVANIQATTKPKVLLTFNDSTTLLVSDSHKIYMGKDLWLQISDLKPGDCVVSHSNGMKEIVSIELVGEGPVISMEIENAHTYVANDIISHNAKLGIAASYGAEYERVFTVQISNQRGGGGSSSSTSTVTIGGQVGIPL